MTPPICSGPYLCVQGKYAYKMYEKNGNYFKIVLLKVHKRDNFLGSDFEFSTFLWLVMLKY